MAAVVEQDVSTAMKGLQVGFPPGEVMQSPSLQVGGAYPVIHENNDCLELPRLVSNPNNAYTISQSSSRQALSQTHSNSGAGLLNETYVNEPCDLSVAYEYDQQAYTLGQTERSNSPCIHNVQSELNSGHHVHMYVTHGNSICASTPDIRSVRSPKETTNEHLSKTQLEKHRKSSTHSNTCRLLSRSQAGLNHARSKSFHSTTTNQTEPSCRRRIICDFEKDLTFAPKLNDYSLKIASRNSRSNVPVVHRLLEARKSLADRYDERLTFAPKLNATSLKMAQERASRMPEVQARMAQQATARKTEALSEYTFKPRVSVRSLRIVQGLGTSFHARQQMYLERRQKAMDEAYKTPPVTQSKRLIKLNYRVPPLTQSNPTSAPQKVIISDESTCTQDENTPTKVTRPSKLALTNPSQPASSESEQSNLEKTDKEIKSFSTDSTPTSNIKVASPKTNKTKGIGIRKAKQGDPKAVSKGVSPQTQAGSVSKQLMDGQKFSKLCDGDRVRRVRINSEIIIKSKKVFVIRDGYKTIRRGLRKRGWVEQDYNNRGTPTSSPKRSPTKPQVSVVSDDSDCGDDGCHDDDEEVYSDEEEYCMMSRAVRNAVPNFVWSLKRCDTLYRGLNRDSLVNHFAKASSFTTKVGLCSNLRNLMWYGDTDPDTFFPRCYRLSCDEEKETFIDDYRLTSALCILKMVSTQYTTSGEGETLSLAANEVDSCNKSTSPSRHSASPSRPSTAPPSRPQSMVGPRPVLDGQALELALKAGRAFISSRQHEDIEGSHTQLCPKLTTVEWLTLVKYFYKLIFERAVIKINDCSSISEANDLLDEIERHTPQIHMEGSRNIWIVKPGAMSRGRGIMCMNNLEDILDLVSSSVKKENKWVVQKYIEKPLLIYDTKFDVRQWFLVTDWNPLTMWIYKDCYVRFCTQKYTLDDLDESVHLCNNSIQRHYVNSSTRAKALPPDNMWDSATFKDYLESIGEGGQWDKVIYPGMKQALVHVLQVTQDEIEHRKCSFELYGADFMISSDYRPWLIEVNSSPAMSYSTTVTSRLCKAVLEDTLKVVVDRRDDKDCDTGGFELAYKQTKLDQPNYIGIQLCVHGSAIHKPREHYPTFVRKSTSVISNKSTLQTTSQEVKEDTSQIETIPDDDQDQKNEQSALQNDTLKSEPTSQSSTPRVTTPKITTCTLDCETPPVRIRSPAKLSSAKRRINHRTSPVKSTVAPSGSPPHENGLGTCTFGENIPNKLTMSGGDSMAVSASTGNVNTVMRFTRKALPNR